MSYELIAMLFLVICLGLVVLEFFLPSGGLIGLLAFVAIVISVWSAKQAWYGVKPGYWYSYLIILIVAIPGSIAYMFRWLKYSDYGERVLLRAPTAESVTPYVEEERMLEGMVGHFGTAETELCPSGVCRIDGQRLDCLSDGMLVERGMRIKVVGHRGPYPIVRELTPDELIGLDAKPATDVAANESDDDTFEDPFADADA